MFEPADPDSDPFRKGLFSNRRGDQLFNLPVVAVRLLWASYCLHSDNP